MISLEGTPEKTLSSFAVKASYALVSARLMSSQMLDKHELAFSLPLSATRYFFEHGVISSTEVAGETVLVVSRTEVTGVTGVPFSTTCTTLFLRLERGSFFLALILVYISWLNFIVNSMKEKHLLKKEKKRKENSRQLRYEINTYSFPRFQWHARRRGKALDLDNDEPKFSDQPGR